MTIVRTPVALMALLALAAAAPVSAATLLVAVDGIDTADCGSKTAPCRSLSLAIAHSNPDDTIVVGPGRYGDIAEDGDFTDPGDETAEVDTGCDCMIHVDKRLTIVSRDGAAVTVLDARGAHVAVMLADQPGTVVGRKGKGFTLTGSADGDGFHSESDDITVVGNLATRNGEDGIQASGLRVLVTDNRIIANGGSGCHCSGNDSLFARNVVTDNGQGGIEADAHNTLVANFAARNVGNGFDVEGGNLLKGNVAVGNTANGFLLFENNTATGNVAHGNHNGFLLQGDGNLLSKSSVAANFGVGVVAAGAGNRITSTSLFGNAAGIVLVPGANANCGTLARAGATLDVSASFWGAPDGPGADPADDVCNELGGTTTVGVNASHEIKVKTIAGR